jgi:pimeloyl-ACP methyl ester carboxylesterase
VKWIKRLLWFAGAVLALVAVAGLGFWARPVSYLNELTYVQEWQSGVESHAVTVAGHRMHYLAEGPVSGPAVVLVHGLGSRGEDWLNLAPWLARAGYRVYLPDLLGYGRSEKPAEFSYSMPDEAAAVVGFFDAVGLKQVDLGGWSMGGWIVQRVASDHPERVRRLILFDSAGISEKPAWDTRLFTPQTPAELDQLDALLMPHPPVVPGYVAQDILRNSKRNAWVIRRALATMMTGKDATDSLLPGLKMPVLLVWGGEDRITPLSQAEKIHMLVLQSQLEVFAGCGHLAPGECAAQIGPKVVEFVKQ